jgi:hypothetical protein
VTTAPARKPNVRLRQLEIVEQARDLLDLLTGRERQHHLLAIV